jgi:hypothetical protein
MSLRQLSEYEERRERQVNRMYNPPGDKNGTLFFVTVNSNKVIDDMTHSYRDGMTDVSYQTTIDGMRNLELALNSDPQYPPATIEDYAIEIGAKALRLHVHFTVLLQHSSANHGEYQLDRFQIDDIFKGAWGIQPFDNIHVNIMSNHYSSATENKLRDYMNQYIGPTIKPDEHTHINQGPRYVNQGMYPTSRDPARDFMV